MNETYIRTLTTLVMKTCSSVRDLRSLCKDVKSVLGGVEQQVNKVIHHYESASRSLENGSLESDRTICLSDALTHIEKARAIGCGVKSTLRLVHCIDDVELVDNFRARRNTLSTNDLIAKCACKKEAFDVVIEAMNKEVVTYIKISEQVRCILASVHEMLLGENSILRLCALLNDGCTSRESKICSSIIESYKSIIEDDNFDLTKQHDFVIGVIGNVLFDAYLGASCKVNNIKQHLNRTLVNYHPSLYDPSKIGDYMSNSVASLYYEELKLATELNAELKTIQNEIQPFLNNKYDGGIDFCMSLIFKLDVICCSVNKLAISFD
ncbi:hypothetical protein [Photobacterium damselae]|uniref:hypothetical protein n=1 Tax=Photobacterium damselae TaxID=38293 RepID=UPI0040684157